MNHEFFKKYALHITALIFWSILLSLTFYYAKTYQLGPVEILQKLFQTIVFSPYGLLIFFLLWVVRPVLFFPASLLMILSGILYGFWEGALISLVAANISSFIAYLIGRCFPIDAWLEKKWNRFSRLKQPENLSFLGILTLRLIFLPFDLVNYTGGVMQVALKPYVFGTLIGIIPEVLTFVSVGAGIENIEQFRLSEISIQPAQIMLSIVLFVFSFFIARIIQQEEELPFIQKNYPLKDHTSMRVGGPADYFAEVNTKEDLLAAFGFAEEKKIPVIYLGQGSNMIVPDKGFLGLVLRLKNDRVEVKPFSEESSLVFVEAGKVLSKLIYECRQQGLKGLDNFVGIPGLLGAAVSGNIGIPQEEIGDIVHRVEIFDGKTFRWLNKNECQFQYRRSFIKDQHFLVWSVELIIKKGEPPKKDSWLLTRVAKQPKGFSSGSFFKNPDPKNGLFAGKLIEECGLKGKKIGGAFVSEKHGNFLMNDGTATAAEVIELARLIKQEVFAKKQILLENEVLMYHESGTLIQL